MRRRLRKKLRRREFAEWGFELHAVVSVVAPSDNVPSDAWDRYRCEVIDLYDDLEHVLHERGLCSGGSIGASWSLVVAPNEKQYVTDEDRELIAGWLTAQSSVTSFEISAPFDVNAGNPKRHALGSRTTKFDRRTVCRSGAGE